MSNDKKKQQAGAGGDAQSGNSPPAPWPGMFDHLELKGAPGAPGAKSARKKRRRVGQLNDGAWLPGYGPEAKKPSKP